MFSARPLSETFQLQAEEVSDAGYYSPDSLPEPFLWWNRRAISDAVSKVRGIAVLQDRPWPFTRKKMSDSEVYEMLTHSGLGGPGVYEKFLSKPGPDGEIVEAGDS